jgi:hypothetical protein
MPRGSERAQRFLALPPSLSLTPPRRLLRHHFTTTILSAEVPPGNNRARELFRLVAQPLEQISGSTLKILPSNRHVHIRVSRCMVQHAFPTIKCRGVRTR